jgi:TolB-like protein
VPEQRAQRQLAAILAADVAGYSRLIGLDEEGTLVRLKDLRRNLIDPKINEHRGRIVKTMGDGLLVQFASAVDAVRCAVEVQREIAKQHGETDEERRIEFRIGINIGDIVIDGDDIHGDGVNVAARLEGLSEPGGIYVSAGVHDQVRDKLDIAFADAGEQQLKNIARPVRVYNVSVAPAKQKPSLPLPSKPSIAVLPFQNMSGDPEQEYFADGVVEEIITALSRFRQLFVIARNSTFTYKGRAVDVKQVGREVGVRYVLEGSVRKSANKVRITGQLIDTATGAHLWADRFDGAVEDIFDLQDQVTARVVGAIAPKIEEAEIERAKQKPTESMDAYDQFLRGMTNLYKWTREGNEKALAHFYRAIDLDPNYAAAYGLAARVYIQRNAGGWVTDRMRELTETERLARIAIDLGSDDAVALATAGFALSDFLGLVEEGDAIIDKALSLNPNLAWIWLYSSWVKASLGKPEVALERIGQALRLSPNDPMTYSFHAAKAWAELFAGRFNEAYSSAEAALWQKPAFLLYMCIAAASAALAGRQPEAQRVVAQLMQADPDLRISNVKDLIPLRRAEDTARWVEGLRLAGIPD